MNKITVSPNIFDINDIHTWYLLDPYTYGSINQTHADFLGKNKQEIERNHIDTVLPEPISKLCIENNNKIFSSGIAIQTEEWVPDGEDNLHLLSITKIPHIGEDGEVEYVTCNAIDITEQKIERQLLTIQHDISMGIHTSNGLKANLDHVLTNLLRIESIDAGGIYLLEKESEALKLVVHNGLSDEFIKKTSYYEAESPQAQLVMKGKPVYTNYSHLLPVNAENNSFEELKAIAVIPIKVGGEVIAAINLGSHSHENMTMATKMAVETIAPHLGEIIQKIRTETALFQQQINLEKMFSTIEDFLFVLGEDGSILKVNQAVYDKLGYTDNELQNMTVIDLHPENRQTEAISIVEKMLKGTKKSCPIPLLTKNGTQIPVETKVVRGVWNGKNVLMGISRDITNRKEAEDKLRKNKERLQFVIEATELGMWDWEVQSGEVVFNDRWAEIIGYDLEELKPLSIDTWMKFTRPQDLALSLELLEKHFKGETEYYDCEIRMKHKDGHWVWVHDKGKVVSWNGEGLPLRMTGTHEDITERKHIEEKLAKYQEDLEGKVDKRTEELTKVNRKLHLEIDKRKKSEQRLLQNIRIKEATRVMSATLIDFDDFDEAIEKSLLILGYLTGASRSYLFLLKENGDMMDNTHEWCAEGVEPQKENLQDLPSDMFPWWMEKLGNNEIIHIKDVDELPIEASAEKEILQMQDIKSIVVLPVWKKGELAGFIGLDNTTDTGEWENKELNALNIAADMIGQTLLREAYKEQLNIKLQIQTVVNEIIGVFAERVTLEEGLNSTLSKLGQLTKSDKSYAFFFGNDGKLMDKTYEWHAEGLEIQNQNLQTLDIDKYTWFMEKLQNNEIIHLDFIPEEAVAEKELLNKLNTKSILILPLWKGDKLTGFIGVTNPKAISSWRKEDIDIFSLISSKVSGFLERKEAERAIINARLIEEGSKKAKSEFIGNMSHELRTPLNSVIGFSDILLNSKDNLDEKQKRYAEHINNNGKNLLTEINKLLAYASTESETDNFNPQYYDFKDIFREVKKTLTPKIRKNNIKIQCTTGDRTENIFVDKQMFNQMLYHLLDNAIKFSNENGIVKVSIGHKEDCVELKVSDNGVGIAQEKMQFLFEPFEQLDDFLTKEHGGLGIGLTLVNHYAQIHGGKVEVESEENKGSTFIVKIPAMEKAN
ncbi:PAS domain S-box protein [Methanohalophilus sp. RSK]|uniref:PAS domain S-box protein n=1 Tax=Methanohalophilus sp. RSK TaxID=2485783 RepID=UPI000F43B37B|nr:PAS domain S-box protein [Methanohalophilus sp. RSK]RNI14553.1 PAS domain S-box protein [Methanohalophilus sp. RSK]